VEETPDKDEFVFILQGIYQRRCSDGCAILDPSRVATFRKNQPYCIAHPVEGGDRSIIVEFNTADLCTALDSEPDAKGTVLHRLPATFAATAPLMLLAGRLCNGVRQAAQDSLRIEVAAYKLLDCLSDRSIRIARSRKAATAEKSCAVDVSAIISSRFHEKLSIGKIAEILDVSPYHLCHSYHAATGTTIHYHITLLRMSEAIHRIYAYPKNLTELALDLGYSSHSHFSSTFKQFFGITPTELMARPPARLRDIVRPLRHPTS
jgi:AraC-like DNA-binding protein